MQSQSFRLRWLTSALLVLGGLMLLAVPLVGAQQNNPVDQQPVSIAAGRDVTVNIKTFCIEYGKPFPAQFPTLGSNPVDPRVVQILRYAISRGYTDSDPYQVQLAIWRQTTGEWKNANHTLAEQIFNDSNNAPAAPAVSGTTLANAVSGNNLQVTAVNWTPLPAAPEQNPWAGTGQLRVANRGSSDLTVALPAGILVDAQGGEQDTVLYVTSVQGQATSTPAATATTAATATPAATATRAATAAPAPTATRAGAGAGVQATPSTSLPRTGGSPADTSWLLILIGSALLAAGMGLLAFRPTRS